MLRNITIAIILFAMIVGFLTNRTYAYWDNLSESISFKVPIGNITIIPLNLNIWQDENILNQDVPNDEIFVYNNLLYIVRDGESYNPHYHGLPSSGNNQWAYVSIELDWEPNMNYRTHSVVVRDGRYFIANVTYSKHDWFIHDPLTSSGYTWSEWREIEPIGEEHFGYLLGTNLRDYANPDWNYIIYKY